MYQQLNSLNYEGGSLRHDTLSMARTIYQIVIQGKSVSYLYTQFTSLLKRLSLLRLWFESVYQAQREKVNASKKSKMLIFNADNYRQPKVLLSHFATCHLDKTIFIANVARSHYNKNTNITNINTTDGDVNQLKRCEEH